MKLFARPLFVSLLFMAIVLSYYGLDYLNYSRAGKLILTGAPTLGLLVLLLHRYPARKWVYTLYVFVTMVLFANLAFQAGLKDIFGVEQDEMMIMKAIFSTDGQESYEFLLQYKPYLLKHFILFLVIFVSYSAITLIGIKQHPLQIGKKIWLYGSYSLLSGILTNPYDMLILSSSSPISIQAISRRSKNSKPWTVYSKKISITICSLMSSTQAGKQKIQWYGS